MVPRSSSALPDEIDQRAPGLAPGDMVAGRYRVERHLATGGMGEVWQATDVVLGRSVALKTLRDELHRMPGVMARFRAEARHAASLSHPNIAAVHDFGEWARDGRSIAYLVMELVPGQTLGDRLRTGPLPLPVALPVLAQMADALDAAHRAGVVHRDVKPGNVVLTPDGTAKVTDFGIALALHDGRDAADVPTQVAVPSVTTRAMTTRAMTTGAVSTVDGTPQYMSPEQARGHAVTSASDIYSLGVVAYETLSGVKPFSGPDPQAVARAQVEQQAPPLPAALPADLRALVASMLSKDPAARPTSGRDVARRLRRIAAGQGIAAAPDATRRLAPVPLVADPTVRIEQTAVARPPAPPANRIVGAHRRRTRLWLAAIAAAAMLLAVVGVALAARSDDPVDRPQRRATTVPAAATTLPSATEPATEPATTEPATTVDSVLPDVTLPVVVEIDPTKPPKPEKPPKPDNGKGRGK